MLIAGRAVASVPFGPHRRWALSKGSSEEGSLHKGYIRPTRVWLGVIYQVYKASVRSPLGNSPPVIMSLDLKDLNILKLVGWLVGS